MANDAPVLHLVVIGFHHKKGYQVSQRTDYTTNIMESIIIKCKFHFYRFVKG